MSQDTNKFKEAFKKVKQIFDSLKNDPSQAGMDITLQDGSTIHLNGALQVGTEVKILSADGKTANAPDGDMTLQDGTVITVKSSIITAIESPGAEDDENTGTDSGDADTDVEEMRCQLAAHDKRISQLESTVNSTNAALRAQNKKLVDTEAKFRASLELNENFLTIVEELAQKPSTQPTERKTHAFLSESKTKKQDEAIQNLSAAFHQLRKTKRS